MGNIDPKLVRSAFIWKLLKEIIEDKWLTLTEIAEKIWTFHSAVSVVLNGKKSWADKFFIKLAKAIWLNEKEIAEIFKKADQEEYAYKYNENINLLDDIDFDVALRKEFWKEIDNETISKIKEFINFVTKK